jgi:hypothetical protein
MAATSPAADVWVKSGFWTGNDFLQASITAQRAYATGLLDGVFLAPLLGAPKEDPNLASLERCTVGMTDGQVTAILIKELRDNPGDWHGKAHTMFFRAMKRACRF